MPKSKFWRFVLFLIFLGLILSIAEMASAQTGTGKKGATLCAPSHPAGAKVEMYPFAKGSMSAEQLADFGLHAERLPQSWSGYNWYADAKACGGGSWRWETLPAGDIVWVARDGFIAYRDKCWNRLAAVVTPPPVVVRATEPAPKPTPVQSQPKPYVRGFWVFVKRILTWPFIGYSQQN